MNGQSGATLSLAKQEFVSMLSRLSPGESRDFLDWIIEQHPALGSDEMTPQDVQGSLSNKFQQCVNAEQSLQSIIEDLRGRLPLSGVCGSEMMFRPEIGQVFNPYAKLRLLLVMCSWQECMEGRNRYSGTAYISSRNYPPP